MAHPSSAFTKIQALVADGNNSAKTAALDPEGLPTVDRRKRHNDSASLVSLVTAVRWGTTTMGLLWAAAIHRDPIDFVMGGVLLAYALFRTFRPIEYRRRQWRSLGAILVELAVSVGIIVSTNCWDSPYIFSLFTPVIAAGFGRGFWHAFRIGATGAVAIGLAAHFLDLSTGLGQTMAWCGELLLVAGLASYGRRLLARAEQVGALNLSQSWRLNEANSLLVSLNRLSHDLPVSFDFQETVANALLRVRQATNPDVVALLLLDPLSPQWNVAMAEGARLPEGYSDEHLPEALRSVAHRNRPHIVRDLGTDRPGLVSASRVGLYAPLWAGPRQVGLLAVESNQRDRFGVVEVELLRELSEPVALTIDNARWFDRLRARGAAQERNRIARDLHDGLGQGVAYVAFELDRLLGRAQGTELEADLEQLRNDARTMVRELRETLYDLRTDVSDEHDLVETIQEFLERVSGRSAMHVNFEHHALRRLPLSQEREVWRICQEAIINAERHADAGSIEVRWDMDEQGGVLSISDDGVGLHSAPQMADMDKAAYAGSPSPGRPSYGLTGMRERAEALGAVLEVSNNEPTGTVVRLKVGNRQVAVRKQATEKQG